WSRVVAITGCLFLLLSPPASTNAQVVTSFFVRSYAGKCLDFGPAPHVGAPVFIFDCNRTAAQRLRVEEINERHEVILRAGRLVIGVRTGSANPFAAAVVTDVELPLELQEEAVRLSLESRNQVFVLDGDSIILAANRNFVVKI